MPTDSLIVHYSGTWAFHNGAVAAGALLTVYNSGTTDLASIFTNSTLVTPSANPVTADANGLLPFAWIGSTAYKVKLTTSGGTTIDEQDVIDGAIDTDLFTAADFAKPDQDMNAKTGNHTVVADDLGEILNCDCTGGSFDITLISAITATNGRGVTIRHVGTANTVGVVTVSSQTITSPTTGVTTTSFELIGYGESVTLESDGANWHVTRYVPPLLRPNTPGVIAIADRVSAAPSSSPGTRYIVASAFSTFEQEDIIEDNGQGGFIEITPPSNCGWVAYVQDEKANYQFKGSAWALLGAANIQVFTTPGANTYTPTAGMTKCLVISTGAGGGSGGVDSDGSSTAASGGGAAGGTCIEMFTAADIGASQTVTIGTAGTAGAVTGGNGGTGGNTTFGALHTATGGGGGTGVNATTTPSLAAGGAGGVPTGGNLNITGGDGASAATDVAGTALAGHGGASFWGGGGAAAVSATTAVGTAGAAYGSGGGGSVNTNDTNGVLGAIGANGVCLVLEFF